MTKTFRDLHVDAALCDALESQGIIHPFAIQELTLPLALDGNDLIGQARTGTGKTLAFGLPLLQRIDASTSATQALVIAPTRELAQQVHEDLTIGRTLGITSISVYGGVPYEDQIEALTSGVQVVVGTPGRLLDHLNRGNLDLSKVTELVLDEADEMLDMGFLPDVERLIEACQGENRHTMLFSATMPTAIVKLARRYMDHPTFTRADHEQKNTAPLVDQHFFQVHRMDKPRILARILQSPNRGGVYVFVRTKHMADRLVGDLEALGTPAIPIHGDLRQTAREKNLDRFRAGKATVLVATEVAARGLDVTGVTHVVNYDCPDDEKMYLHRIGRTARAGEAGVAVTFAEFNESDRLNVIRKAVGATDTEVLQVFSTSPELTELFDLPDEKPWDALVKEQTNDGRGGRTGSKGSAGSRSTSRSDRTPPGGGTGASRERSGGKDAADGHRSDDSRSDAPATERAARGRRDARGRSDGRPKNERGSEGPAKDRGPSSSGRTAPADGTSGDSPDRSGDRTQNADTDTGGDRVRTRSRTRSRTRDTQANGSTDRNEGRDTDTGSSSGRTRARPGNRGEQRDRRPDAAAAADSEAPGDGDDRNGGRERSRGGGRSGGSRSQGGSGGRGTPADQADTEKPDSQRSRSRGDAGKQGGKGGRTRSDTSSQGGRSGRDRGGRSGRDRGGRSGRDQGSTRTPEVQEDLQKRGPQARGEGQPQASRRVKVEHLP